MDNSTWMKPGPRSKYKDGASKYEDLHDKDKLVLRPSNLYNGIPFTGKMISLYWDSPQGADSI